MTRKQKIKKHRISPTKEVTKKLMECRHDYYSAKDLMGHISNFLREYNLDDAGIHVEVDYQTYAYDGEEIDWGGVILSAKVPRTDEEIDALIENAESQAWRTEESKKQVRYIQYQQLKKEFEQDGKQEDNRG